MENFDACLKQYTEEVWQVIQSYLPPEEGCQKTVLEAMNYSMKAGGKRLRPLFLRETYRMLGGTGRAADPFMAAIEMIHTFSLVHDDLPCMDNDRYRRGLPTTWVQYGYDMAVLAGDALYGYAFETAAKAFAMTDDAAAVGRCVGLLARKSGIYGMIGGQTADVELTGKPMTAEQLDFIYREKTGALLEAPVMIGAILAGAPEDQVETARQMAACVGMAFQIQDDILDYTRGAHTGKPSNNDLREHKITLPLLLLLDRSDKARQDEIRELLARCHEDETAVDTLQAAVEGEGCLQEASKVMHGYLQRAASLLAAWPDGPVRTALVNLCAYIAERNR